MLAYHNIGLAVQNVCLTAGVREQQDSCATLHPPFASENGASHEESAVRGSGAGRDLVGLDRGAVQSVLLAEVGPSASHSRMGSRRWVPR